MTIPDPIADLSTARVPTSDDDDPTGPIAEHSADGQHDGPGPGFPLTLPLRGRRVLVIGGGESATQMVTALRPSGALIRVVAPTLSSALTELAARGLIEVANRQYQARDLADAWLAFACSDHRSVNAALAFDAEQARVWCVNPEDAARPPPTRSDSRSGRRALVLGGARSGKSAAAQAMLADCLDVDHVATGETLDLASILVEPESSAAVLIDSLATWLSRTMDDCGRSDDQQDADSQLAARQDELIQAWEKTARRVVVVSNEVGSGIDPVTESGRRFRDELGCLNTRLAEAADEVWLCTAGIASRLK